MNKFQLAATVDRLIYDDRETFSVDDATALIRAMPPPSWRRFLPRFSVKGSGIGSSTQGIAAGFGNVSIREEGKDFEFDTQGAVRVGQWKLYRGWRSITIEQMASDQSDDQRSAMLIFSWRWTPIRIDLLVSKALGSSITIGIYRPWKRPNL